MQTACQRLALIQTEAGQLHCTQAECQGMVRQYLIPEQHWRCGNAYRHRAAWLAALQQYRGSGHVDEVLTLVQQGIRLRFVDDTHSPGQQRKPDFQQKRRAVLDMLGGPSMANEQLLRQRQPPSVWVGNLQSALSDDNVNFINNKVAEALAGGMAVEWQQQWGKPHSISPLGCAINRVHKQRMTITPLLVNFYEQYLPFRQERLQVSSPEISGVHAQSLTLLSASGRTEAEA
jgi:hypothetical protein